MASDNPAFRKAALIGGAITGLAFSIGPVFLTTFAVFMGYLEKELGRSRGELSLLFAVANLAVVVASPLVGGLVSRHGARPIIGLGSVAMAGALALFLLRPSHFAVLAALFFLVGFLGTGTHTFVYLSMFPRWFTDRLGLTLGLAMTGIGIGQTIAPLLANALITRFGWHAAYTLLGLLSAAVSLAVVAALLPRTDLPSPASVGHGEREPPREEGISAAEAARMPGFWMLVAAFVVIAAVASACLVHLVLILTDEGLSASRAAEIAASAGIAIGVSRLAGGYLLDRIGPFSLGICVFLGAAVAPLLLLRPDLSQAAVIAPILLGMAYGVEGDLMPYLAHKYFGRRDYEKIYSRFFAAASFGVLVGPLSLGASYDTLSSYGPGLVVGCGGAIGAACLLFLAQFQMGSPIVHCQRPGHLKAGSN